MKKIFLVVLTSLFMVSLSACGSDEVEEAVIDIPEEGVIYAHNLPYYEYMNLTNPIVLITVKDIGVMELELFPSIAKNTVDNFISYVENGAYTDNEFHRIIEGFMIQGGNLATTPCPITGEFSANGIENDLAHNRGVLSTARTSVMDSATSQFFIMHQANASLDGNYAAFGGLVSGFNILDYIATVETDSYDYPLTPIVIESITIDLRGYEPSTPICAE